MLFLNLEIMSSVRASYWLPSIFGILLKNWNGLYCKACIEKQPEPEKREDPSSVRFSDLIDVLVLLCLCKQTLIAGSVRILNWWATFKYIVKNSK